MPADVPRTGAAGHRVGCEGLADPRLFVHVGGATGGDGSVSGPGTIRALSCHQQCSTQKCLAADDFPL